MDKIQHQIAIAGQGDNNILKEEDQGAEEVDTWTSTWNFGFQKYLTMKSLILSNSIKMEIYIDS